jgi:hypothetical protein
MLEVGDQSVIGNRRSSFRVEVYGVVNPELDPAAVAKVIIRLARQRLKDREQDQDQRS